MAKETKHKQPKSAARQLSIRKELNDAYKVELKECAETLGLHLPSAAKKSEFVEAIAQYVLNSTQEFLQGLTQNELNMLELLCDNEDGPTLEGPLQIQQQVLYKLHLMECEPADDEGMAYTLSISDELCDAIKGIIKEENERRTDDEFVMERCILSVLNLFGVMPLPSMIDLISRSFDKRPKEVADFLHKRYLLKYNTFSLKPGFDICTSPFLDLEDVLKLTEKMMEHKEVELKQDFSQEELLAWGEMPYPVENVEIAQPLIKALTPLMPNKGFALAIITEYWATCQLSDNPSEPIRQLFATVNLKSPKDIMRIMNALTDFNNHMPRWEFLGHSATEARQDDKTSRNTLQEFDIPISMGAPFFHTAHTAADADNDEFEEMLYEGIDPHTGKKIRPNDPCPCGSGLKYKKCHGQKPN